MRKAVITYMLMLTIISAAKLCYGGSISAGQTVDVSGGLRLLDGQVCFPDLTCMSTAVFSDGSAIWGQITGYIDDQLDLSIKFATKEDKASKNIADGYAGLDSYARLNPSAMPMLGKTSHNIPVAGTSPEWQVNVLDWTTIDAFSVGVVTYQPSSRLNIKWSDNVGVYHTNWCNIGIFLDEQLVCGGAWSGVYNNTFFSQQSLDCLSQVIGAGLHNVTVKHRSQYCVYGNYVTDDGGATRSLRIKEEI